MATMTETTSAATIAATMTTTVKAPMTDLPMDTSQIIENINATVMSRFAITIPTERHLELSKLCYRCHDVFDATAAAQGDQVDGRQHGEVMHHSLEELAVYAKRGCHLCLTSYQSMDPDTVGAFRKAVGMRSPDSANDLDFPTSSGFASIHPIARDQARLTFRYAPRDLLSWQQMLEAQKSSLHHHSNPDITLSNGSNQQNTTFPTIPELKAEFILMNPRYAVEPGVRIIPSKSTSTSSTESFEIAKQWIEDCMFNHMKCSVNEGEGPIWKPKHLLDVNVHDSKGNPGVKLVDGQFIDPLAEYLTLSHCWGISRGSSEKQKHIRLHRGTLPKLRQGVALTGLPKTIADAATATVKLGFNYLWVDALCMMHDSETDVLSEMANMQRIYSEATVNLAATSSRDDHAGLFFDRKVEALHPVAVDIGSGFGINEGVYKILRSTVWEDLVDAGPLCKRAWIYQERALCRRTLHFSRSELLWECQQACCSEVFPKGLPITLGALAAQKERKQTVSGLQSNTEKLGGTTEHQNKPPPDRFNKKLHHQRTGNWDELVESYSRLKLTYPTDKLLAFAGMARQYMHRNRLRQSDYMAGLWRPHLIQSLLWTVEKGGWRSSRYRAPSWSWASVDGPVTYPTINNIGSKQTCLEVISIDLKHKTDDVLGLCEEGSKFQVRGFMGRGWIRRTQDFWGRCSFTLFDRSRSKSSSVSQSNASDNGSSRPSTSSKSSAGSTTSMSNRSDQFRAVFFESATFDCHFERLSNLQPKSTSVETLEVFLVPVIDAHTSVSGLVLTATDTRGAFKRIGTFDIAAPQPSSCKSVVEQGDPVADFKQKQAALEAETKQRNWDKFRLLMKGDPDMDNYVGRLDHANGYAWASDYTYTFDIF